MRGRRVCVLATGVPMQFGVGATLARAIAPEEMTVVPSVSAFTLAAARLGWPLDEVATITLHARPIATLARHVHPGARLLALARDRRTPAELAAWLVARGFGKSRIIALVHMAGPKESRVESRADMWRDIEVPDLHTLAVECVGGPDAVWHPPTGLADGAFEHDGKLTKREIRAAAIGKLMPHPGALLIDVGAGCGSVCIEWMRAARGARAIAIEPDPARRAIAARNAAALGVPELEIRNSRAPEALQNAPHADAVFIGGGVSSETIVASMDLLRPGGRLVAHAVTLESEAALLAAYKMHWGELVRLSVARAEPIGGFSAWRSAMPVTQWAWRKT
jgi:precorrin-6Y C5,15-methyltransferase (decarboxylating)